MNVPNRVESVFYKKEIKMKEMTRTNRNIDALGWGALFIWWGITLLVKLPAGIGLIGVGLILLAANAARYYQEKQFGGFTTVIGVLALVWGGLELAGTILPFELPVFPILLVVLGLIVLFGNRRDDVMRSKEA
jgi:hypothetical protein